MQSLGEQMISIIKRKYENIEVAENNVAILIKDEMLLNTKSGKAFGNDEYNNEYSSAYAKRKKGGKISPVTLRDSDLSIEKTRVDKNIIGFENSDKAYIFRLHHEGRAKGGKTRSIFPKSNNSIPQNIKSQTIAEIKAVLSGK